MRKAFQPINHGSRIFATTIDSRGVPSIMEIDHIEAISRKCIEVRCCSCSRMAANLWEHPRIAILVWNVKYNLNLRLSGRFLHMRSTPLTGGNPSETDAIMGSHTEMNLTIEIDEIEEVERAVHGEVALAPASWPVHLNRQVLRG